MFYKFCSEQIFSSYKVNNECKIKIKTKAWITCCIQKSISLKNKSLKTHRIKASTSKG